MTRHRDKPCLFLLLALCLGCGDAAPDYTALQLVAVTGRVTLDEKPLSGAMVRFIDSNGSASIGFTDADGRYRLRYDSNQIGVRLGIMRVEITTGRTKDPDDPDAASEGELLPAKYHVETELQVEVTPDALSHDFALSSS
jgi:hypothetical protein